MVQKTVLKTGVCFIILFTSIMILLAELFVFREYFQGSIYQYSNKPVFGEDFKGIYQGFNKSILVADEDFINGQIIFNSSTETEYTKCLNIIKSKTEPVPVWKLQPKPCSGRVSIVIIIKSSVVRNSLRHALRKTWAKDMNTDFGK